MALLDLKSKFSKRQLVGFILIFAVTLILFGFFLWQNKKIIKGEVLSLDLANRQIELKTKETIRTLKINERAKIIDQNGAPIAFSEIVRGYWISAKIAKENGNETLVFLKVIKAPDLIIDRPQPNEKITGKIIISGRVKISSKEIYLTLKDQNKNILLTDKISKNVEEITPYLEFFKELDLPQNHPQSLWLEIYQKEPESGMLSDKIIIPLIAQ